MAAIALDILYALGLVAAGPVWLARMIRHKRYRTGWPERLGRAPVCGGGRPVIWIHAVSLGEVNGIRALVDELAAQVPDHPIVISSTTDTGLARARALFAPRREVFQFPLDFSWAVRRAFDRVDPALVVLMEGEMWPNFLACANRRGVPVVVVNGRMSENKGYPRYRKVRPLAKRLFNRLTVLAVQDEVYAERFIDLGADPRRVTVTGMMKFDTVDTSDAVAGADALAAALGLSTGDRLVVAGGTGPGEESMVLEMFAALRAGGRIGPRTFLAIVPRKPERFDEVARLIERGRFEVVRRTARPDGTEGVLGERAVILGDTMGELRKFYSLADAVFVGRSLVPMGGSDMLEAVALGKPVAFGPHVFNFPQVPELLDAGGAVQVADADALGRTLTRWLADADEAAAQGRRGRASIRSRQGATARNVAIIRDLLGRAPAAGE
ncbi:MAG: 3-deoxy-D-manno-octulosonic acid transferase [Planctomycetota bacterium]